MDFDRMITDTAWGIALETLRISKGREWSIRNIETRGVMKREQYKYIVKKMKYGPSVSTLDHLLMGMGLSWSDWAKAYEKAKIELQPEKAAIPVTVSKKGGRI